ncbi:DUF4864 domain-containing protein [Methylobacterium organophilum]|uniref:DUF4864 domain-containing protein n=1 Tax=Methylobacterium organophilum TaxID=410 RepID=UPI001F13C0CA|nr:DUF4864 domain-containing protein [Methylobacterium organophilum]UMY18774.1 DUF4864 domain-containing protein [Methylobacterium organophilum]
MRIVLSGVLLTLLMPAAGLAADEADRQAARGTIARQIEAFRRNDPATAYDQAAPQIRTLFPSPETFLAMVEKGYPAVLRPRSYSFAGSEDTGEDEITQGLSLQDENGIDWLAVYSLQKQTDGQWRITGCQLRKAPGSNT